ncbi:MAG: hypothetical protein HKM04_07090 [Legionellales bacterium]|nr:hypothetical protein [Legionellales bacterium]
MLYHISNFQSVWVYEFSQALNNENGVSASFLIQDVPLRPYLGNNFFFIYDPNQLEVLLASTTDASTTDSLSCNLSIDQKGKPIVVGNGTKDYNRYKNPVIGTTEGIKAKVIRMEQKRRGIIPAKNIAYLGWASFAHTELLVKIKDGCKPEDAIIGIGMYTAGYCNSLIDTLREWRQDKKLNLYVYDPIEKFSKVEEACVNNPRQFCLDKVSALSSFFTLSVEKKFKNCYQASISPKGISELDVARFSALKLIYLSIYIEQESLSDFDLAKLVDNLNDICFYADYNDNFARFMPLSQQILQAETITSLKAIEHQAMALIFLCYLFNKKGKLVKKFSEKREEINHFTSIAIDTFHDDNGMQQFSFEKSFSYQEQTIILSARTAMQDGLVKIVGELNGYPYEHRGDLITLFPSSFLGDLGLIHLLSELHAQKSKPCSRGGFLDFEKKMEEIQYLHTKISNALVQRKLDDLGFITLDKNITAILSQEIKDFGSAETKIREIDRILFDADYIAQLKLNWDQSQKILIDLLVNNNNIDPEGKEIDLSTAIMQFSSENPEIKNIEAALALIDTNATEETLHRKQQINLLITNRSELIERLQQVHSTLSETNEYSEKWISLEVVIQAKDDLKQKIEMVDTLVVAKPQFLLDKYIPGAVNRADFFNKDNLIQLTSEELNALVEIRNKATELKKDFEVQLDVVKAIHIASVNEEDIGRVDEQEEISKQLSENLNANELVTDEIGIATIKLSNKKLPAPTFFQSTPSKPNSRVAPLYTKPEYDLY